MGGIRAVNLKDILIPMPVASGAIPPHTPTTTATVLRVVAPKTGRFKGVSIVIAVASAFGNSADILDTLQVQNGGAAGTATTLISNIATVLGKVAGITVAVGQKVLLLPPDNSFNVVEGDIIKLVWTETGTLGTGTRPTFQVANFIFEAAVNADPRNQ